MLDVFLLESLPSAAIRVWVKHSWLILKIDETFAGPFDVLNFDPSFFLVWEFGTAGPQTMSIVDINVSWIFMCRFCSMFLEGVSASNTQKSDVENYQKDPKGTYLWTPFQEARNFKWSKFGQSVPTTTGIVIKKKT